MVGVVAHLKKVYRTTVNKNENTSFLITLDFLIRKDNQANYIFLQYLRLVGPIIKENEPLNGLLQLCLK